MNILLKIGLGLIALSLLFSCEKTIEFKGDNMEPKIVVNSILVVGEPISVQIMKSRSLLSDRPFIEALPEAKALLYEDGVLLEALDTLHLPYPSNNGETLMIFSGFVGKTIPKPGKTYRLEVSNDGLQPVSCETTVPQTVEIVKIDTITEYTVSEGNQYPQPRLKITFHFSDPAAKENYYRIESRMTEGYVKNNHQLHIPSFIPSDTIVVRPDRINRLELTDPVFKSEGQANEVIFGSPDNRFSIFDDALIDGKDYGLMLFNIANFYDYGTSKGLEYGNFRLQTISLISLSKEYHDYLHSVNYHSWYSDDFFSEPYPVLSNVRGGMGIFGSSNISTAEILFGEYPMAGKTYIDSPRYGGGYGY